MLTELAGPFVFGLSAFTLIFAATEILNIGKLVSNEHAPIWAALLVFLWSLPGDVVLVIPMALLLGTLLAVQRLSGESEMTAMKAAGITFARMVAPLLAVGILMSFVTYLLQEGVVPYANGQLSGDRVRRYQARQRVQPRSDRLGSASGRRPPSNDRHRVRYQLAGAAARNADSIRQPQRAAADRLCRPGRVYRG